MSLRALVKDIPVGTEGTADQGYITFVEEMCYYIDEYIEVEEMNRDGYYDQINGENDNWSWLPEWLIFDKETIYNVRVKDMTGTLGFYDGMKFDIGKVIRVKRVNNSMFQKDGGWICLSNWVEFVSKE